MWSPACGGSRCMSHSVRSGVPAARGVPLGVREATSRHASLDNGTSRPLGCGGYRGGIMCSTASVEGEPCPAWQTAWDAAPDCDG